MLKNGKVTDGNGDVLEYSNDAVKAFMQTEEVRCVKEDRELFNYFFEQIAPDTKWTNYYDEPTRKVKYKYEDGLNLVSCISEAIIEAPLVHVLSLFSEIDMFKDWFPNVTECGIIKQVTNYRGMYSCK